MRLLALLKILFVNRTLLFILCEFIPGSRKSKSQQRLIHTSYSVPCMKAWQAQKERATTYRKGKKAFRAGNGSKFESKVFGMRVIDQIPYPWVQDKMLPVNHLQPRAYTRIQDLSPRTWLDLKCQSMRIHV